MIKFRQFILESKKKKKKLTPHELKHGVATHFEHERPSKKKLKESVQLKTRDDVFKSEKPNEHLFTPDTGHMENFPHLRSQTELDKKYNFHETPHTDAVKEYTSTSSEINKGLYDSHISGHHHSDFKHKDIEHWGDTIKQLDQATTHHTLTHPLTVYSGVTKRVPEDAAKHPERKVYHPGFVSTTLNPKKTLSFLKPHKPLSTGAKFETHVLRIHLKPGHKMLHVGKNSHFPDEQEVILPRGHTFKISDKPEVHHITNYRGEHHENLHVWDAHIDHTIDHEEENYRW